MKMCPLTPAATSDDDAAPIKTLSFKFEENVDRKAKPQEEIRVVHLFRELKAL